MEKEVKIVVGVDEVGRGPLAGPVMACAITCPAISNFKFLISKQIQVKNFKNKDSKKLSAKQREEVYEFLKKCPEVCWGVGRVGEKAIDKINIFEATKLAMIKAIKSLEKKIGKEAGMLLIDGNFAIPIKRNQKSIIKGDEKIFLISLASIVAKVTRDRLMDNYHRKYPLYGFDKHKGYGTKLHIEAIKQNGYCKIHRMSFKIN